MSFPAKHCVTSASAGTSKVLVLYCKKRLPDLIVIESLTSRHLLSPGFWRLGYAHLAPYVHPKMPTLVARSGAKTEQYVIRVPNALSDGQAWAHAVLEVKASTAETQVNGSRRNG